MRVTDRFQARAGVAHFTERPRASRIAERVFDVEHRLAFDDRERDLTAGHSGNWYAGVFGFQEQNRANRAGRLQGDRAGGSAKIGELILNRFEPALDHPDLLRSVVDNAT